MNGPKAVADPGFPVEGGRGDPPLQDQSIRTFYLLYVFITPVVLNGLTANRAIEGAEREISMC